MSVAYCSEKCLVADASRHKAECMAVKSDRDLAALVRKFSKGQGASDTAKLYRVGGSATHRITVRRTVETSKAAGSAAAAAAATASTAKSKRKSTTTSAAAAAGGGGSTPSSLKRRDMRDGDEVDPLDGYRKRFAPDATVPCRPWISFGSPTSVVVSWLPPTETGHRFTPCKYVVQIRGDDDAAPPGWTDCPWQSIPEPHTGTVPSHIVNGLLTGSWIQFRVAALPSTASTATTAGGGGGGEAAVDADNADAIDVDGDVPEDMFSDPSGAFRVGFADFACGAPGKGKFLPPSDFSAEEFAFFQTLDTPSKIQDYLDTIPMNHEIADDTCLSVLESVRQNQAHCIEGAMLGAYILSLHGHPPYIMDMRSCSADDDHIVTPFQVHGRWGCLSVSNHASLRFRNPVYKTLREMMMSYFDDYMNGKGTGEREREREKEREIKRNSRILLAGV